MTLHDPPSADEGRPAPPVKAADLKGIDQAVDALCRGEVVVLPTDTVYGLVCLPAIPEAVERIFSLKQRPGDANLQILIGGVAAARQLARPYPVAAEKIARRFWPGGVTLVLHRAASVTWHLGSDSTTLGLRCPDHAVPLAVIAKVGPVVATSANLHGQATPKTAAEIAEIFPGGPGGVSMVLDGGVCDGAASTVVDLTGERPTCLRAGRVAWDRIFSTAG